MVNVTFYHKDEYEKLMKEDPLAFAKDNIVIIFHNSKWYNIVKNRNGSVDDKNRESDTLYDILFLATSFS